MEVAKTLKAGATVSHNRLDYGLKAQRGANELGFKDCSRTFQSPAEENWNEEVQPLGVVELMERLPQMPQMPQMKENQ